MAAVIRRMLPPLPAASHPSNTTTEERFFSKAARTRRPRRPCAFSSRRSYGSGSSFRLRSTRSRMVSEASSLRTGGGAGLPAGAATPGAGEAAASRARKRSRSVRPAIRSR